MKNNFFEPSVEFNKHIKFAVLDEWFAYDKYAIVSKLDGDLKIGYISGPMTKTTGINSNIKGFYDAISDKLLKNNIYPINMHKIISEIPERYNASYIDIMHLCFKLIDLSDEIFVNVTNDDWMESGGVLSELSYAKSKGIIINPVKISGEIDKIIVECEGLDND